MILADTSVWVDHLRSNNTKLQGFLNDGQIIGHPFVIGEIALGYLRKRTQILSLLQDLPPAITATEGEVLIAIERCSLAGEGIGYVDAHLLAAVQLTTSASLWTRDRRLLSVAERLQIATRL